MIECIARATVHECPNLSSITVTHVRHKSTIPVLMRRPQTPRHRGRTPKRQQVRRTTSAVGHPGTEPSPTHSKLQPRQLPITLLTRHNAKPMGYKSMTKQERATKRRHAIATQAMTITFPPPFPAHQHPYQVSCMRTSAGEPHTKHRHHRPIHESSYRDVDIETRMTAAPVSGTKHTSYSKQARTNNVQKNSPLK